MPRPPSGSSAPRSRCPEPRRTSLILALDEMLANIIEHGYRGDPAGTIRLRARRGTEQWSSDRDRLPPLIPSRRRRRISASLSQRAIGGLGIASPAR